MAGQGSPFPIPSPSPPHRRATQPLTGKGQPGRQDLMGTVFLGELARAPGCWEGRGHPGPWDPSGPWVSAPAPFTQRTACQNGEQRWA